MNDNNIEWKALFPHVKVSHLQVSYSDHVPILITTAESPNLRRNRRLPRRFEEKWVAHPDCEGVIHEAWGLPVRNGSPMFTLFEKIKQWRHALVDWSRITLGNSKTRLEEKKATLEELSRENKAEHMQRIRTLKSEINTILHQDELFWRQRSRSIWLPAGDKNTKIFHQRASQWRRKNHISGIQDVDGSWKTSEDQITQVAESYFQNLFTSENPMNMESVLDVVDKRFTTEMNSSLLQRYTAEEVRQALFQLHPSNSPGPDGMSPFFFQKFWNIVGSDVTEAILSVLNSGHMLRKMNFTHIVLIPKKSDLLLMADYRPISLTNVVSRILSKVMANRLKHVLPYVISEAQSAFVPNRLITDNTTVAYELLHRMRNKRRGKVGQMAVKLDISKAYDRLE